MQFNHSQWDYYQTIINLNIPLACFCLTCLFRNPSTGGAQHGLGPQLELRPDLRPGLRQLNISNKSERQ